MNRDQWRLVFFNQELSDGDRQQMRLVCRLFNNELRTDLMKPKIYSTGMVSQGLLNKEIFRTSKPDFIFLYDLFKRMRKINFEYLRLNEEEWPLFALLGREEELKSVGGTEQRDANGRTELFYLALGGHDEVIERWIENVDIRIYGSFDWTREPLMLEAAMASGNEKLVRLLINKYGYPLEGIYVENSREDSVLFRALRYGCKSIFWERVEAEKEFKLDASVAIFAAQYGQWDVCDEIIARGIELTEEEEATLACYGARDDIVQMKKHLEKCKSINFNGFNIDGNLLDSFACMGGQIEILDYIHNIPVGCVPFPMRRPRDYDVFMAAQHGNFELLQHIDDSDQDNPIQFSTDEFHKTILHYAIDFGDEDYLQKLIAAYYHTPELLERGTFAYRILIARLHGEAELLKREIVDFPLLNEAVKSGHLYFAQQFLTDSHRKDLLGDLGKTLLKDAEESGNKIMVSWVQDQIQLERVKEDVKMCEIAINRSIP